MKKTKIILALIVLSLSLVSIASAKPPTYTPPPTGLGVYPYLVEDWKAGNAEYECEEAADWLWDNHGIECSCDFAYKIEWKGDGDDNGVYLDYGNYITISGSTNKTFSWTSDQPVCCVIVKASTKAYIYHYNPTATGDTGLVAPEGKDISHVTFCMEYDVPEFPIPETPLGTIASMLTMLGAAALLRNKLLLTK